MIFLVGGVARSGKSTLAERLRRRRGVPWFPLDALKMGLFLGAPVLAVHPDDPDLETADRMWPVVQPMIENLVFAGRDYLFEGVNLRPETVVAFARDCEVEVRICFLGYPDLTAAAKAALVAAHPNEPNDWLSRRGADYILPYLEGCIRRSRVLRATCEGLGVPFFDTGADFEGGVERALAFLAPQG
jgi:predicted kinase